MYLVKSPHLLKWFYSSLTWNKSRTEKIVYLTFDDGPIPNVTDFVLNTLKTFKIKATFFCIGDNIQKHPQLFERLKSEGHSIGNHTFNHLNGWKTANDRYIENVLTCHELTRSLLFRPPYGRIRRSQIKQLHAIASKVAHPLPLPNPSVPNFDIIMWDVLSADFDIHCSPEQCYQNVIRHTQNGSIIVFHDSLKAFPRLEYALPRVIKYLLHAGYRFDKL